jgi:hypothetical protein
MKVILRGESHGFCSETFDFSYVCSLKNDAGQERYIVGGRLAFMILNLFFESEFINYGHGYENYRKMYQDLEDQLS